MDKINKFLSGNAKYSRLKKPLEAANVCDTARGLANDRFSVVSFRDGLLTLGVSNSAQASDLQLQSCQIIEEINEKLEKELVKRLRFKMI